MISLRREELNGLPWVEHSVEFGPVQLYRIVTSRRGIITIRVIEMLRKNGEWTEEPYFYADTDCEIVPRAGGPVDHPWGSGRTAAEAIRNMTVPSASPEEIRRKEWD